MENASSSRRKTLSILLIACSFLIEILWVAYWTYKTRTLVTNSDAVAYVRLGMYFARADWGLAISAYWSPLFSWAMVPLLKLGAAPVLAGRIVAAISATLFLVATLLLWLKLSLSLEWIALGLWIVACRSGSWTFWEVTPDFLMTGLFCIALSCLIDKRWIESRRLQILSGLLLGMAYLAKAVALPAAAILLSCIAMYWWWELKKTFVILAKAVAISAGVLAIVALPWVAVLSHNYGYLTFSTAGSDNYAVHAPGFGLESLPVSRQYYVPRAGRITTWEQPDELPFPSWSAFSSKENFRHELETIGTHARKIEWVVFEFDKWRLGFFSAIVGLFLLGIHRGATSGRRWLLGIPIAILYSAFFLPVGLIVYRYFYPAYVLLFASAIGVAEWLGSKWGSFSRITTRLLIAVVLISFAIPPVTDLLSLPKWYERVSPINEPVAARIVAAGLAGPVAGAGEQRPMILGFYLGQPYYGHKDRPSIDEMLSSGARLLVVDRGSELAQALRQDSRVRNLDSVAFFDKEPSAMPPSEIFIRSDN